jgi:hypothetical protein
MSDAEVSVLTAVVPAVMVEAVTLLKSTLGPRAKEAPTIVFAVSVAGTVKFPFVSSQ